MLQGMREHRTEASLLLGKFGLGTERRYEESEGTLRRQVHLDELDRPISERNNDNLRDFQYLLFILVRGNSALV
jgi:hypothetical protein